MKVSLPWLQTYFESPLPSVEVVADALTFHSCEIEEMEGEMIDVKVLPDRASYALSHRGIALEVSASLGIPLQHDPLTLPVPALPETNELSVEVDDAYVLRHIGAIVRGVRVGPSPEWLVQMLSSVGQRSINNIVDATNYVMLNIGQPLHAFDLDTITKDGEVTRIDIRRAHDGEQVEVLTGETYTLTKDMFVVGDKTSGTALDIAGLKGGMHSGVTEKTTNLFISVGTYDGTLIRKMSQNLKLWTDASLRYQNRPSPQLCAYGMRDILKLIGDIAGGEVVGVVDVYPHPQVIESVTVSLSQIKNRLGADYSLEQVRTVFDRLLFAYSVEGETFKVTPPFERKDILIPEDLIEEVGRVGGYEHVLPAQLPPLATVPDQTVFRGIERIKDLLIERGYSELSTQSFAREGDIELANPLDQTRPWLRASLVANMEDALTRAVAVSPRVFGPLPEVRLFELGSTFTKEAEHMTLCIGHQAVSGKTNPASLEQTVMQLGDEFTITPSQKSQGVVEFILAPELLKRVGEGYEVPSARQGMYVPFSLYPFALRDIAVWVPEGTEETEVAGLIQQHAGEYLARMDLFDRFQKEGRVSYAFRLVFESGSRTLSDKDLDPAMADITLALQAREGFEVR
jgi:phenylalanyl-tRNA synthetase beta chain